MVRRWSYITTLNRHDESSSRLIYRSSFDVNINTTMYLRKLYTLTTTLTRRRWSRRKHIHTWLHLTNILRNWASTYRFYRNLNKSIFTQFFFKNSLLAFNLVSHRNSIPCLHRGTELVVTASFTKRMINYYNLYSNPKFIFFKTYKFTNMALISYNTLHEPSVMWEPNSFLVPLVSSHASYSSLHLSVSPTNSKITNSFSQSFLTSLTMVFKITLNLVTNLYKILVLLTLWGTTRK